MADQSGQLILYDYQSLMITYCIIILLLILRYYINSLSHTTNYFSVISRDKNMSQIC